MTKAVISSSVLSRVAFLLITLWAGSLWTVCGLVAPSLFAMLDHRLAGQLAAYFFLVETWIGVVVGTTVVLLNLAQKYWLPSRWPVLIAAGLPLLSHLALGPLMERARLRGDMSRFGLLHGVAGGCFVAACIALLVLIWKLSARPINPPAG
jgi:hypothetical protein